MSWYEGARGRSGLLVSASWLASGSRQVGWGKGLLLGVTVGGPDDRIGLGHLLAQPATCLVESWGFGLVPSSIPQGADFNFPKKEKNRAREPALGT